MSTIEVTLEASQPIINGLATGQLERVGGVIRETSSGQVVAWLRDSGVTEGGSEAVSQAVMSASGTHSWMGTLAAGSPLLLNSAISGASLIVILNRLNAISDQIRELKGEFDHDRRVNFESALEDVRDILEAENSEFAHQAVRSAVQGLFKAQRNFLKDFSDALSANGPDVMAAHLALTEAMYAAKLRARCYLAADERDLALKGLSEAVSTFEEYAYQLIDAWLGEYPGAYLHPSLPEELVDEFVKFKLKLKSQDFTPENILSLIKELRADFWNSAAVSSLTSNVLVDNLLVEQMRRRLGQEKADGVQLMQESLTNAEVMLENFERIAGFELELRSMRLSSFAEWESFGKEEAGDQDYLIVDNDILERVSRLAQ